MKEAKIFIAEAYDKGVEGYLEKRRLVKNSTWNYMDQKVLGSLLDEIIEGWGGPKGKVAVDMGCGPGLSTKLLRSKGLEVAAGFDISVHSLELARKKNRGINFIGADAEKIPLANGIADLVFGEYLPNYLPDLRVFAGEVGRILKPQGECLISMGHPTSEVMKGKVLTPHYFESGRPYTWPMVGSDGKIIFKMISFHHTFQDAVDAFAGAGLSLVRVIEEQPQKVIQKLRPDIYEELSRYPSIVAYRFRKN